MRDKNIGKKSITIVISISIVLILSTIYLVSSFKRSYTLLEFHQDYLESNNGSDYKSFKNGDIVKIKDRIRIIDSIDNRTLIKVESTVSDPDIYLLFKDNLSTQYFIGDNVIINIHIVQVEIDGKTYETNEVLTSEDIRHTTWSD